MSYTTVEVELENGRVSPRGNATLPAKAHALLTILESDDGKLSEPSAAPDAGLLRFISSPDFALTPEQFRASMEVDIFEQ